MIDYSSSICKLDNRVRKIKRMIINLIILLVSFAVGYGLLYYKDYEYKRNQKIESKIRALEDDVEELYLRDEQVRRNGISH